MFTAKSKVLKLEMSSSGEAVLVFSLDPTLTFVYLHNEVSRTLSESHVGAVIAGDLSKTAVASVGCDGYLHIYSVNKT